APARGAVPRRAGEAVHAPRHRAAGRVPRPGGRRRVTGAPGPVAIPAGEIAARVAELAAVLGRPPPAGAGALPGPPEAAALADDLVARLTVPVATEGIQVTAFGEGGGHAQLERPGDVPLGGRDVVIVTTIVDTGLRLRFAARALLAGRPASVAVLAL